MTALDSWKALAPHMALVIISIVLTGLFLMPKPPEDPPEPHASMYLVDKIWVKDIGSNLRKRQRNGWIPVEIGKHRGSAGLTEVYVKYCSPSVAEMMRVQCPPVVQLPE